jgi:hypothetical protein
MAIADIPAIRYNLQLLKTTIEATLEVLATNGNVEVLVMASVLISVRLTLLGLKQGPSSFDQIKSDRVKSIPIFQAQIARR